MIHNFKNQSICLSHTKALHYSQKFDLTCLSETNFQQVFQIDTQKETVFHKTSFNFNTNKKFDIFENEYVILFTIEKIAFFKTRSYNDILSIIDLNKNKLLISSIYTEELPNLEDVHNKYFHNQLYTCFRSG